MRLFPIFWLDLVKKNRMTKTMEVQQLYCRIQYRKTITIFLIEEMILRKWLEKMK